MRGHPPGRKKTMKMMKRSMRKTLICLGEICPGLKWRMWRGMEGSAVSVPWTR
jgi:hypothetical protein